MIVRSIAQREHVDPGRGDASRSAAGHMLQEKRETWSRHGQPKSLDVAATPLLAASIAGLLLLLALVALAGYIYVRSDYYTRRS